MERKFQLGEEVVHKSDREHRMTVLSYDNAGNVVCRWKGKRRFERAQFLEDELEKWTPPPQEKPPIFINPRPPRY